MPHKPPRDLPALSKSLLQKKSRLVVWGGTDDLLLCEWQRQIPAEFLVDTRWRWWDDKVFFGMPVRSPSEIARLDPAKTIISNNFFNSNSTVEIEEYLARIGGFRTLNPISLQELARHAGTLEGKKFASLAMKKGFIGEVRASLRDMLIPPAELHKKRELPPYKELVRFFNAYSPAEYLDQALPELCEENARSFKPRAGHACMLLGGLLPGGAERQFCNLAVGLKRAGWTVTVLLYYTKNEMPPYRQALLDAGVNIELIIPPAADEPEKDRLPFFADVPPDVMTAFWHLRPDYVLRVAAARKALRRLRPELLVCYLDNNNATGGLGGALAGVPRIFLSGRSTARPHLVNPAHLLQHEANRDLYRMLARQKNVFLSNNSPYGAETYAKWIGVPKARFSVVRNCVSEAFTKPMNAGEVRKKRALLDISEKDILILGVFRIHPIKRPLDFVRVVGALHKKHPRIRAVICGAHDEDTAKVRELIKKLKLESVIRLPGVVEDVHVLMRAATLLLHTAEVEGSPNVVLESQALGLPVVSTETTGARICLDEGWKPFMRKMGDAKGLAKSCDELIRDGAKRKKIAAAAQKATRSQYSIAALARDTLAVVGMKPVKK